MTNEQFEIYKEFIDEELKLGNIDDIKKIINYTKEILKKQKLKINIDPRPIEDKEFNKVLDILNQSLIDFLISQNIEDKTRKALYNTFYLENISRGNLITAASDLKVYHTLGLPINQMGLDINMIDAYEHALNNVGLSIYNQLTDFQKLELNSKTKIKQ